MPELPPVTIAFPVVETNSRYTAVDQVVVDIVMALLKRDLVAGSHTGQIDRYGGPRSHFRVVNRITGPEYGLELTRPQGRIGGNGQVAIRCSGLSRVTTTGVDWRIFPDDSGPKHSESDIVELVQWLRGHVLAQILGVPEVPGAFERQTNPPPIPYPTGLGSLLTWCSEFDAQCFIEAKQRGSLAVNRANMMTLRCVFGNIQASPIVRNLPIPGRSPSKSDTTVLGLTPLWANDIVVVDYGAYLSSLRSRSARARTLQAMVDGLRAMAQTEQPIHFYDGSFSEPVVYMRRHLVPEEAQPVGTSSQPRDWVMEFDFANAGAIMRAQAATEYAAAFRIWTDYNAHPDPTDAMWAEVVETNDALVAALLGSWSLMSHFDIFLRTQNSHGEPANVQDFVAATVRWALAKPEPPVPLTPAVSGPIREVQTIQLPD